MKTNYAVGIPAAFPPKILGGKTQQRTVTKPLSGEKTPLALTKGEIGCNVTLLVGIAGFEPAREGVKVPCLTAWRYPSVEQEVRRKTLTSNLLISNGVGSGNRTHGLRDHNPTL